MDRTRLYTRYQQQGKFTRVITYACFHLCALRHARLFTLFENEMLQKPPIRMASAMQKHFGFGQCHHAQIHRTTCGLGPLHSILGVMENLLPMYRWILHPTWATSNAFNNGTDAAAPTLSRCFSPSTDGGPGARAAAPLIHSSYCCPRGERSTTCFAVFALAHDKCCSCCNWLASVAVHGRQFVVFFKFWRWGKKCQKHMLVEIYPIQYATMKSGGPPLIKPSHTNESRGSSPHFIVNFHFI